MITIIHGADIVASRTFFLQEKEKQQNTDILDGEKITLTDLAQIFEGGGLFEETKTVFIEHIFSRKKRKEEFAALSDYIQKQTTHTIYLWEGKELEKSALTSFKTAMPRVFKLPQTLFSFLDNLRPGNGKQLITLFHQTLETTDPEMIFFMLVRQFRLFLAIVKPTEDAIDELKRLAPWQKTKLQQQASTFGEKNLKRIYQQLFTIETGQKTGTLPNTILTSIDFLLLEI
jgi:hypothetical protein